MKIESVRTNELLADPNNAKVHTTEQIKQIANSIDHFGFNDPIAVWHDADGMAYVVEGHGRLAASSLLGIDEVPTISLDDLSDEERRAYAIVHNAVSLATELDPNAVAVELDRISDIDMSEFGFEVPKWFGDMNDSFSLSDADGPAVKTMTIHPTDEQYEFIMDVFGDSDRGETLCKAAQQVLSNAGKSD